MRINIKYSAMLFAAVFAFSALCPPAMRVQADGAPKAADAYNQNDYQKLAAFLEIADAAGVKNGMKLSASYDVLDPTTWGVDASGEPRFGWTEKAGKLSLQSVNCPNIVGGLCGILDLSSCEALETVVVRSNALTGLSVSGCSSLYLLNCAQNYIASLDIFSCSALRFLECRWNRIPNLDVSGCPELSVLICTDNRLKTLDLRANPLISGVKFLRMADSGNKFISCYIAQDPEYNDENLFFISADCAESCTTYHGWYTEDGRFVNNYPVFTPTEDMGTSFVARFALSGAAPGDADGSGSVDLADALRIMRIAMGLLPMQQGADTDVNADSSVNMTDAMLIMRRSMGLY